MNFQSSEIFQIFVSHLDTNLRFYSVLVQLNILFANIDGNKMITYLLTVLILGFVHALGGNHISEGRGNFLMMKLLLLLIFCGDLRILGGGGIPSSRRYLELTLLT